MIETIQRCSICKSESCGGKEYNTPDMYSMYGHHVGIRTVCESSSRLITLAGQLHYRLDIGHGASMDYPVTETTQK